MARRPRPSVTPAHEVPAASLWRYAALPAIAWIVLFAVYFFSRPVADGAEIRRFEALLLLPELLSERFTADDESLPSGWRFLPQRFDLMATAALLAAGIWGIGRLVLRAIGQIAQATSGATNFRRYWLPDMRPIDHQPDGGFLRMSRLERNVVAFGLGIAAWSLLTLLCGLAGWLSRPLFLMALLSSLLVELVLIARDRRANVAQQPRRYERPEAAVIVLAVAAAAPFLLAAASGSMLPPFDFDVKEYHLGGPKEWYLDGRVHFLPHNVYTSFPALTEMLSLSAMVVRGDWFRGALAGQLLLAGFLPLTAATVFATGRRLFGRNAGLVGAIVFVTIPWVYRISAIAYAEGGLTCYLALTLLCFVATLQQGREGRTNGTPVLVTGLFAGSALACKYPGVVQVVIPIGIALVASELRRRRPLAAAAGAEPGGPSPGPERVRSGMVRVGAVFTVGVCITAGPWLVKNTVATGNPVYPLMGSLFDARDWDAELNAKWRAAHRPPHYEPASFFGDALRIAVGSDGQSLLVFGLAPLALLGPHRRSAAWLWLYVGFLYVAWWALTHRIDRFWIPLLPVACLLAGAGATWMSDQKMPDRKSPVAHDTAVLPNRRIWRFVCGAVLVVSVLFNTLFLRPPQPPGTGFLSDLQAATAAATTPSIAALNGMLPEDAKVLLVGEAEIFDARFPLVYNTVFDRNIFEAWTAEPRRENRSDESALRGADDIRRTFAEHGVTHVFVNWREILRYRTTYGFTPFVTPDRFESLQQTGVFEESGVIRTVPLASLPAEQRLEAERAFPSLIRGHGDDRSLVAGELFPVVQ